MEKTLKLLVPLVVALLCIRTAAPLSCETCEGTDTCESKPCDKDKTMCYAQTILKAYASGKSTTLKQKGCANAMICPKPGTKIYSTTMKHYKTRGAVDCCTCDNCNKDFPPVPPAGPGFRNCTNCDPAEDVTILSVSCNALEEHCFRSDEMSCKPNSSPGTLFGCASEDTRRRLSQSELNDVHFDPPVALVCEVCSGPCNGPNPKMVSVVAPPGMKCFSATIQETFRGCTSKRTLKGITADHMCPKNYWSYSSGNTHIKMRCCSNAHCNRHDWYDKFNYYDYKTLKVSNDLRQQLGLLGDGQVIFPPPAAAAAPEGSADNGLPDDGFPDDGLPDDGFQPPNIN